MFKQILLLIVFSVVAVLFREQLAQALKAMLFVHTHISHGLGVIFAFDKVGEMVQSVIALLLIPVVIAVLFAVAHFFIRQAHFPHTVTVVWVFWAVLLTSLVSHKVYDRHMVSDVHMMHMDAAQEQHHDEAVADNADNADASKDAQKTAKNDALKDPQGLTKGQPLATADAPASAH